LGVFKLFLPFFLLLVGQRDSLRSLRFQSSRRAVPYFSSLEVHLVHLPCIIVMATEADDLYYFACGYPSVATLLPLLAHFIVKRVKFNCGRAMRVAELMAVTCGSICDEEKGLLFDHLVCWLEQQDDPSACGAARNVPSSSLLMRASVLASQTLPMHCPALHKLWFLRIFNSVDQKAALSYYDHSVRRHTTRGFVQGFNVAKGIFRDGFYGPATGNRFDDDFDSDPVRGIRYEYIMSFIAGCKGDWGVSYASAARGLDACLEASRIEIMDRWDEDNDLFQLRKRLRVQLASFHINNQTHLEAMVLLSASAVDQRGEIESAGGDDTGYIHFLRMASVCVSAVTTADLHRLTSNGMIVPHDVAEEFALLMISKAWHFRLVHRAAEGHRLLLFVIQLLTDLCPSHPTAAELNAGVVLHFTDAVASLEDALSLYTSPVHEE
jgi:hypothetical protein